MSSLRPIEVRLLQALARSDGGVGFDALVEQLGIDQSQLAGAATVLAGEGLIEVSEQSDQEWRLGPRAESWSGGAPERRVAEHLQRLGGRFEIKRLGEQAGIDQRAIGESLKWLALRDWAEKQGAELILGSGWNGGAAPQPDEKLVERLRAGAALESELARELPELREALELLASRSGVTESKLRKRRTARLTAAGRERLDRGIELKEQVTELTTELLISGRWRELEIRPYDVSLPGPQAVVGKEHPFRRILEQTRRVFLEMGFSETESSWVEAAFWDFDALFQPQDHPARDMQDTFYLARPERLELPDAALTARVAATHENGGTSGSLGWRTRWNPELARQAVLRTHTTAATIRELARQPSPPRKVFCVGPVFRREAIDYKHLPVFHQVDGIVIDEQASFAGLLSLLSSFYRKMGFDRVQFRPAFFPYTEPSVECFVFMEERQDWVEMGGSGIFRPEVTEPFGCTTPVLAWGLGLERLAMFRYHLSDIRELYLAHLEWLEGSASCRS